MSFYQFILVMRSRWLTIVGVLGVVVLGGVAACLILPKQYAAAALVLVDSKHDPAANDSYSMDNNSAVIGTQVDIAASQRVAQRVVTALQLDQDPAYVQKWRLATEGRGDFTAWLASTLIKRLSVKPSPESNVISITVKWPDPQVAATLANAFAEAYIATTIALKVDPAKQYANSFDARSRELRVDLEAKQKLFSDFENTNGIVAADERIDVENARLSELSTQLVAIQAQRQESQSRERQAKEDINSIPEVLQNPLIASLKADLSKAESRQQDIATSLGTNHPEYKSTGAEVTSLRQRLAQESARIVASLSNTTRVNQLRENEVSAALETQKNRVLALKHLRDQAAVLQSDVATAQRNLDAVTQRLAQSSLESQTQQTSSILLAPATEPVMPVSPNVPLILMLTVGVGGFIGLVASMLFELANPRVRSDQELIKMTGVPILGTVSSISYPPVTHSRSLRALEHLKATAD
jgi:chain length determinant protein EpsF